MKHTTAMLLFLFTGLVSAQNIITGTLLDAQTNSPISFASVYIPQLEKGRTTDELGTFEITDLPSGNYKIIVSFVGYKTYSETITIPLEKPLNISLAPTAIEIEEVIVSTPFHKLQSDNVMKVEQQKVIDLKAQGSVTLADGISNIAGVSSITTGIGIGKPVIRGLSSNRVLVYAQGIRLENQQFGDEHGLGVNDAGIESIEVIKGPASLLYGSDALGGVLYLNPERFAQANTNQADVNFNYFSNTQGYSSNAGFKSSGEAFKFIFRGAITEHSDYKTQIFRVTNSRFRDVDFKSGLGYQSTNFKTELRYNINSSQLGIPEEIGEQSTNRNPLLPFQEIQNHILSSKSTIFFDNSSLEFKLGFTYNNRKEFEEHHEEEEHEDEEHGDEDVLEPALHMKLKTFNYDVKYNLPDYGKFETIAGIQGLFQTNTNYGEELLIPDASIADIGVMVMSHIHFKKADVQLGLRYDKRIIDVTNAFKRDFNSFNAALGVKTNILESLTARVNFASGFRAPNLAELASDGTHEGTNRYEIGNPNLNNEQSLQIDVSLEYENEHFELFANGFYNIINDYIFLSPDGTFIEDDPVFNYLQDDARLFGGEFGLHIHPHPLDWLHLESSLETVTGIQDNDDYLPLIPANTLTNTLRIEFKNDWLKKGNAFVRLQTALDQNKIGLFETSTSGYSLLSAGFGGILSCSKNALSISISGNNLTNKVYTNHLSRLKGDNIPNIGRNLSIGLSYIL